MEGGIWIGGGVFEGGMEVRGCGLWRNEGGYGVERGVRELFFMRLC